MRKLKNKKETTQSKASVLAVHLSLAVVLVVIAFSSLAYGLEPSDNTFFSNGFEDCSVEAFCPAKLTLINIIANNSGGNAVTGDWSLTANAITFTSGEQQVVAADSYTLAQAGPGGYTTSPWVCTGSGDFSGIPDVGLSNGDVASCTIQNTDVAPRLTLNKSVTNSYGGNAKPSSFNLTLQGIDGIHNHGIDYKHGATPTVRSNVTYTVTEVPIKGYTLTGIICLSYESNVGTTFSLNEGQNVICTFSNQDKPF